MLEEREAQVTGRAGRRSGNNTVSLNQHFQENGGGRNLWQVILGYATRQNVRQAKTNVCLCLQNMSVTGKIGQI